MKITGTWVLQSSDLLGEKLFRGDRILIDSPHKRIASVNTENVRR